MILNARVFSTHFRIRSFSWFIILFRDSFFCCCCWTRSLARCLSRSDSETRVWIFIFRTVSSRSLRVLCLCYAFFCIFPILFYFVILMLIWPFDLCTKRACVCSFGGHWFEDRRHRQQQESHLKCTHTHTRRMQLYHDNYLLCMHTAHALHTKEGVKFGSKSTSDWPIIFHFHLFIRLLFFSVDQCNNNRCNFWDVVAAVRPFFFWSGQR